MSFKVEDYLPADTPAYMYDAWYSCLQWAINRPEIVRRFENQKEYKPMAIALKKIDDQSGMQRRRLVLFIEWFNENVWGAMKDTS